MHIVSRCRENLTYGVTKLNKILWWVDFLSCARHGEPITGVEYQKLEQGPVPRPLPQVRNLLVDSGSAAMQERQHFNRTQERLLPLHEAMYDQFNETHNVMSHGISSGISGSPQRCRLPIGKEYGCLRRWCQVYKRLYLSRVAFKTWVEVGGFVS